MSTEVRADDATGGSTVRKVDMKLEAVVVPVSDVDRAKRFYDSLGASYSSFCTFSDPDGNGWLLQEITTRLPGRVDAGVTSYSSVNDVEQALVRAATAHGQHEKRTGQADENWPAWYARYMVAEQSGADLPS